jgi:predicted nucleotide-binding protein with TIR-like domain
MTFSKDELLPSVRDNVLFECGLFMGRLGRDRVFIVYDQTIKLKIPSDLAGITLAPYEGSRFQSGSAEAAVRKACLLISDVIKKPIFRHIVGEWRSKYRLTAEISNPLAEEDVDIKPSKGGLCIISRNNTQDDEYIAQGNLVEERFLLGKWKVTQPRGLTSGVFCLR